MIMEYWKPRNNGLLGAVKSSGAYAPVGAQLAANNSIPEMEMPKVGDKLLLQAYQHGMINVFDDENSSPSPQATYIEVEVKALKKAKISYE